MRGTILRFIHVHSASRNLSRPTLLRRNRFARVPVDRIALIWAGRVTVYTEIFLRTSIELAEETWYSPILMESQSSSNNGRPEGGFGLMPEAENEPES